MKFILTLAGIALSVTVFAQSKKAADTAKTRIEWKLQNPNAKPVLAPQDDRRPIRNRPDEIYSPGTKRHEAPNSNIYVVPNMDSIPKK